MGDYSWIGPLVNAGAGALANSNSNAASEEDKARYKAILAKLGALQTPGFDTNALTAEAGQLDPELKAKQMQAMAALGEIQKSGGLTLADQAALNKVLNQTARQESAGRNAIQARMDARGTGSSGANLAMQLSNNQAAANRANETGMNTSAAAQKRYLQSILEQGQLSGQMSDRDIRAKQARDLMNQYNQKNKNTYAQQGYNNDLSKITGQMPGTAAMVGLNQAQAGRNSEFISDTGAGVGALATDLTRTKRPASDASSTAPTGYGTDDQYNNIDDEFENG